MLEAAKDATVRVGLVSSLKDVLWREVQSSSFEVMLSFIFSKDQLSPACRVCQPNATDLLRSGY